MAHILVVEDEPVADAIKSVLKSYGHMVEIVRDGAKAVIRAESGAFDLIVLDVQLPEKDGYEVCRELRAKQCESPILMLTIKDKEAEKVMGLDMGADDYLVKPFGNHELRARVDALLRRARRQKTGIYHFGNVEVDLKRAEIRVKGTPISVTSLEYKLLEYFIEEEGNLLSHQKLLDRVWGGAEVAASVVRTHIWLLRNKCETDPQHPIHFVSVRALGYRFEAAPRIATTHPPKAFL